MSTELGKFQLILRIKKGDSGVALGLNGRKPAEFRTGRLVPYGTQYRCDTQLVFDWAT